jgi:hypothetical protein
MALANSIEQGHSLELCGDLDRANFIRGYRVPVAVAPIPTQYKSATFMVENSQNYFFQLPHPGLLPPYSRLYISAFHHLAWLWTDFPTSFVLCQNKRKLLNVDNIYPLFLSFARHITPSFKKRRSRQPRPCSLFSLPILF